MDLAKIRELYDYNRWANGRCLEAASRVSHEDFTKEIGGSFASLRGTLGHLYGAEWIWLERWRGRSPRALPSSLDLPDVETIRGRWKSVEREQEDFLEHLDPERLEEPLTYTNLKGENWTYVLWRILAHVVNHSSYHRGQVATLLRQLGATPLSTDLLLYYDETQ
jgi:uncharacterized damage-inducible protein DinB